SEQIIFSGRRTNKKYEGKYCYLQPDNSQKEGNNFLMESLSNPSSVLNEMATSLERKFRY
ncbi:MAG: hypothetical protein Q7I98_05210, partial [Erysipelotrichaceae bacterium]|nr:hypothetical protein [Erysipelotrichaceae bacterium]